MNDQSATKLNQVLGIVLALLTIFGTLFGGMAWATTTNNRLTSVERQLDKAEGDTKEVLSRLRKMELSLERISEKVGVEVNQ